MSKLWLKHQKFMKGNAGFSLVELIIVIAIMAALIAILAPQYLKYVEKSRVSADQTQIDELVNAVKVAASDPDATYTMPQTVTVAFNATTNICTIGSATVTALETAVITSLGGDTFAIKSSTGKTDCTGGFTVGIAATTFEVTLTGIDPTSW